MLQVGNVVRKPKPLLEAEVPSALPAPAQEEVLGDLRQHDLPRQKPQGSALAVSSGAAVVWGLPGASLTVGPG